MQVEMIVVRTLRFVFDDDEEHVEPGPDPEWEFARLHGLLQNKLKSTKGSVDVHVADEKIIKIIRAGKVIHDAE